MSHKVSGSWSLCIYRCAIHLRTTLYAAELGLRPSCPSLDFAMSKRPPVPAVLKRRILVEAGHRCAIPTCRHPTVEIAHIVPYAVTREHTFENLIALCPTCHTRFDRGEIDRQSMLAYKRKLVFLSDRYSQYELNVLDALRHRPYVVVHGDLAVKGLLDNDLLHITQNLWTITFKDGYKVATSMVVELTESGRDFIGVWADPANDALSY